MDRYQPFFIESNQTFRCIYEKYTCIEEGQKVYSNGSIYEDRSCFCDFKNGYAFVNKTSNKTHCVPSKEDCTCYKKICPENSVFLNTGYVLFYLKKYSLNTWYWMIYIYTTVSIQKHNGGRYNLAPELWKNNKIV